MKFRAEELTFRVSEQNNENALLTVSEAEIDNKKVYTYPNMTKTLGPFKLTVEKGSFKPSEIVMMLGQNGTGKTTLIKMLAGILTPDDEDAAMPQLSISYKP